MTISIRAGIVHSSSTNNSNTNMKHDWMWCEGSLSFFIHYAQTEQQLKYDDNNNNNNNNDKN